MKQLGIEYLRRFIGGQVEIFDRRTKVVHRGTIKAVTMTGSYPKTVRFTFEWLAVRKPGLSLWNQVEGVDHRRKVRPVGFNVYNGKLALQGVNQHLDHTLFPGTWPTNLTPEQVTKAS